MSNSESKREQLQQERMPVVDWQFKGSTIRPTSCNYLPLPQVVCWEEFDQIQDAFLLSMETESTRSPPVGIRNIFLETKMVETQSDVLLCYNNFMNAVFYLLDLKYLEKAGYTTSRQSEDKQNRSLESRDIMELAGALTYHLDILYCRKNQNRIELSEPVVVLEVKRVTYFRIRCDRDLPDLVVTGNFDFPKRQLYTYMSCTKTGYGILSSGDVSFFFKREATDNGESVLKISKGVLWDNLLIPMAAFCHTAFGDRYKYKEEPERFNDFTPSDGQNEEKEPSLEEDDKTNGPYRAIKTSKKTKPFHMVTRSMASTSNEEVKNLSLSIKTTPFASGSCGNIYLGKVEDCKVAVKLTLCGTAVAKTLQNEVLMYKRLKAYWGQCVPALLSHGTLAEGRVMYLATKFVESLELGKEFVTSTVIEAAVTALQIIHSCSILHGDISKQNILVVNHGHGGVYFIDFGLSQLTSNKKELQREIAELKYLLESLMVSGNGKASRLDNHIIQSAFRTWKVSFVLHVGML